MVIAGFSTKKQREKKVPTTSQQAGYSAERGGYVDAMGNVYPTNNPNFKPSGTGNRVETETGTGMVTVDGKKMTVQENLKRIEQEKRNADYNLKQQQQQVQETLNANRTAELQAAFGQPETPQEVQPTQTTAEALQNIQNADLLGLIPNTNLMPTPAQQIDQAAGGLIKDAKLVAGLGAVAGAGYAAAALTPTATTAATVKEATTVFNAVKAFKWGSYATAAYGIFTKTAANGLTSDIKTLVKTNKKLADQVKLGADPLAIKALMDANRQEILNKAADLRAAKKISLADRLAGLDAEEDIQLALVSIAGTNAIVDEYILTGNPAVLDKLGAYGVEE